MMPSSGPSKTGFSTTGRLNNSQAQNKLPYWYTTNNARFSSAMGPGELEIDCYLSGSKTRSFPRSYLLNVRLVGTNSNAGGEVVSFDLRERRNNFFTSLNHIRAA